MKQDARTIKPLPGSGYLSPTPSPCLPSVHLVVLRSYAPSRENSLTALSSPTAFPLTSNITKTGHADFCSSAGPTSSVMSRRSARNVSKFSCQLLKKWEHPFVFLSHQGVEPTNLAEHSIRPAVQSRKLSYIVPAATRDRLFGRGCLPFGNPAGYSTETPLTSSVNLSTPTAIVSPCHPCFHNASLPVLIGLLNSSELLLPADLLKMPL